MMYEKETKIRPLICMDTDGIEQAPMFMSLNEDTVRVHHKLYLKEATPHIYRLCSSKFMTASDCSALRVHCPLCNRIMKLISAQQSGTYHALYACDRCR